MEGDMNARIDINCNNTATPTNLQCLPIGSFETCNKAMISTKRERNCNSKLKEA
jgi:hypothetical protein